MVKVKVKKNMAGDISAFDKSIRVWIGLSMIVGSIQNAGLLPWSAIGALLLVTAWQGYCPLYALSGFRPQSFKLG